MLRAAAAPERFLDRGFARFLSRTKGALHRPKRSYALDLGVTLPLDLTRFLNATRGGAVGDFVARSPATTLLALIQRAYKGPTERAELHGLLSGAVPFGVTREDGHVLLYFITDPPARSVIATLEPSASDPRRRRTSTSTAPGVSLICRGAAALALMCAMHAAEDDDDSPESAIPESDVLELSTDFNVADEEAVRAHLDRGHTILLLLLGTDPQIRGAIRALAHSPLDVPKVDARLIDKRAKAPLKRPNPFALGPLVEAFFRERDEAALRGQLDEHASSPDAVVKSAASLLMEALDLDEPPRAKRAATVTALLRDLLRRRAVALRTSAAPVLQTTPSDRLAVTRQLMDRIVALPPSAESYAALHDREETLLALAELGDRSVIDELTARAKTGDASAVDMLSALGDESLTSLTGELLQLPNRTRRFEIAVTCMQRELRRRGGPATTRDQTAPLRQLLRDNPMTNWREGLDRGVLVRELVTTLGECEDQESIPMLVEILESTSQEYRAILPVAAYALGKLRHGPALPLLDRLLFSPKDPVSCEVVWAVGAIGEACPADGRALAVSMLEKLHGLEPGAEVMRITALARLLDTPEAPAAERARLPTIDDLRNGLERALWEPAFRQEETSRRRACGLRALEDLSKVALATADPSQFFLGHNAIRHFLTRDDHRVRCAAERAFAAWSFPVPKVRRYFEHTIPEIERRGGVPALLEAIRDPLGVFRHNVATRLSHIGDPRAVRPLAEATARLIAESPTSTYEYDDVPPHLVAFVRALARLNSPEGNDVLIEGLKSDNHQVRAVIAENAPDDERFVPELMAMLGDPRSFLRSRAEKSLTQLGAIPRVTVDPNTTEVVFVRRVEG